MQPDMLEIVRKAINAEYAALLPDGFEVFRVDEYTQAKYPAPNLWYEKTHLVPEAKYVAILLGEQESVPALGVTVNDAVKRAIAKIEARNASASH